MLIPLPSWDYLELSSPGYGGWEPVLYTLLNRNVTKFEGTRIPLPFELLFMQPSYVGISISRKGPEHPMHTDGFCYFEIIYTVRFDNGLTYSHTCQGKQSYVVHETELKIMHTESRGTDECECITAHLDDLSFYHLFTRVHLPTDVVNLLHSNLLYQWERIQTVCLKLMTLENKNRVHIKIDIQKDVSCTKKQFAYKYVGKEMPQMYWIGKI